ncbi:MAG: FxsA family protein [Alphaproteobacteria bacterium]|nr:FxsA family protein [Alphaproteobacteria bacterium]
MGLFLLLAFIATPIAEIAVFIEAGSRFGLWPTVMAIIATAVLGAALLRWQGLATLSRVSQSLQRNELPVEDLFTGLCLVAAGALLLTPGFITDSIGFLLFVPPFRRLLGRLLRRFLESRGSKLQGAAWQGRSPGGRDHNPGRGPAQNPFSNGAGQSDGPIIDGEFQENDPTRDKISPPQNPSPPEDSPWRGPSDTDKPNNRKKP